MARLWDKGSRLDEHILNFTAGEDHHLDKRLLPYDIRGSVAHTRMLQKQGLLGEKDCEAICAGLEALGLEHRQGEWSISLEDEDVHTALESRLIDRIGPAGGRVHLGRSRNDQVLVALRLYMKDAIRLLANGAGAVAQALDELAGRQGEIQLPGYTHMQPAMPSSVGLWASGWATELRDDADGLTATVRRADINPLGSAAGYGPAGLPLDRDATRHELGFSRNHEPVTAVQISRGKAEASLVFEISLLLGDLGRLASDLLLFFTKEFGFVSLPDEMTTGSSIMPQKRNPDVFELVRSAPAVGAGALMEVLTITKSLGSGYQRDLQRLKAPLFRSIDLAEDTVLIMSHALKGVHFHADRIELGEELRATERASQLALKEDIPFREAYRRIAAELHGKSKA